MNNKRVVITGIGVVSAIGCGIEIFQKNLFDGKSGIANTDEIDLSGFLFKQAGEVKKFEPKKFIKRKNIRFLDRVTRFAISASVLAVKDSGLKLDKTGNENIGTVLGSIYSGWSSIESFRNTMETDKYKRTSPALFPNTVLNSPVSQIAIELGNQGPCTSVSSGFASGADALSWGYDYIKNNKADIVIAGGADELNKWIVGSYIKNKISSHKSSGDKYNPFSLGRKGVIAGEGSCMLIMEDYEHAVKRGADIYCEMPGYFSGRSTFPLDKNRPVIEDFSMVVKKALECSETNTSDVDFICAEGNGISTGDYVEFAVIRELFGNNSPPVTSIKPTMGHTSGAAGAFNAAACCLAIKEDMIPPTINYSKDPEIDMDIVTGNARKTKVNTAISNAFSTGGNATTIVFKGLS